MRNRELACLLLPMGGVSAVGCIVGFLLGFWPGVLCFCLCAALCGCAFAFTRWRYLEIKKLSAALAGAAGCGQVLDVRTNREGELSILRNDIYKVTSALAGQALHLQRDKAFLAGALEDISHQLKTPLTSLLVHSDLLQNKALPPEKQREFLRRMSAQLERLRWLVFALLKLSRVDACVVDFKREALSLHALLAGAIAPLLPLAEEKNIAINIDCPRSLVLRADKNWTEEALCNLVKNCVEHAPTGGQVWLRCIKNPLHTLLYIEDDGPGFAREDLPWVFERFYRGKNPSGEGVGIGLAMAKSILQAQQATLAAENRPQGGARFVVKFH